MPALRASVEQLDFRAGIVRDVAPQASDPRSCYDIQNGLLDEDASIYKRGGTVNKSTSAFGASGVRWLHDAYFDAGQRTVFANNSNFGVLAADDSVVDLGGDGLSKPVGAALIESLLFIGGGYIYGGGRKPDYTASGAGTSVTNGSKTVTRALGGFTANLEAGMLMQVSSSERVYVVASVDSDTQVTLRDDYAGSTSGTTSPTFYGVYEIVNADPYPQATSYAVVDNRLCALEGNRFSFSALPNVTTGAPNPHSFPTNNYYDFPGGGKGVGIGVVGDAAIVFTTAGVWVYDGLAYEIVDSAGTFQHRIRLLSTDLILVNEAGIASFQQALVVPCLDGIYLLDGVSSPRRVSRPIDSLYRRYTDNGYWVGKAAVYRGHYFLPILSASAGDAIDLLVGDLNHPLEIGGLRSFPWTRFSGSGGAITAFAVHRLEGGGEPKLYGAEAEDSSRVVDASGYFEPDITNTEDADGSTFTWMLVTRDYETGGLTANMVRKIRVRAELFDAGSDNPTIIFEYGTGATRPSVHLWNRERWDDLDADDDDKDLLWESDESDDYTPLECVMSESNGIDPFQCRVNTKARYIRFRLRNLEPASSLRLRSIEVLVRPSQAVRR